ncbi:phenylacetate--CoA ligase family protein [Pseudanabaena sp. FACHB-2040]|uniref:phenylacetate--CoA ligase family protein n=1 Tax=Pseudanabaena sp. FACHB-2040 TaxID=2692859 RepID=UPI001687077A|nr:phenylacetate--CoA ligase family protein [Pseudanabaena sp. FACHB-2040]MBD2257266.1 phenylacetate--CoA ligase family protein [Pseudanabaena sp. FACHB-2040]
MSKALISYVLYPLVERQQKRNILPKLAQLRAFSALSREARSQAIQQRLAEMVAAAAATVPYYRDLFQAIGFDPERLAKDSAYFQDIPYLTKDIIREQGERLLSESCDRTGLHVRKTGGSTGPSTLIYYDDEALDWTAAANLFVLEWTGKKRYTKEAHFSSEFPEEIPWRDRLRESIKCITLNRVNIRTADFDDASLENILRQLQRTRPYSVQGHPSTLYTLALYAKRHFATPQSLFKVFESTGEVLDGKQRDAIADVFKCQIFDRYGNAEFGVVAHSEFPQSSHLKVLDFMVWSEAVAADTQNEIVFTGLRNAAMPLLRYKTGDLGDLVRVDGEFYITNIAGRIHDMVRLGNRQYPTHYLQDLLDRLGGIDEFQLEQVGPERCLLRLVLAPHADPEQIQQRVTAWWGEHVALEFVTFNDLKRVGWRSKFRHLVNTPVAEELGS